MKVYVMLADGFEEIEAIAPVDVLRRGEVETVMVSVKKDRTVTSAHSIVVIADKTLDEISVKPEDMVLIPGGLKGVQGLEASEALKAILKEHHERKGWLASICAGPSIPGKLGFYKGHRATCYPGFEKELQGAVASGEDVVVDKNFITSRGPGVSLEFAYKILSLLKGEEAAKKVKSGMLFRG